MTTAIVLYDDRFAQKQSDCGPVQPEAVTLQWGKNPKIVDGEITNDHWIIAWPAVRVKGLGGGPMRVKFHDQKRYPNQGFSCVSCPYLSVTTEHKSPHCNHPLYLELYGAPQSINRDYSADPLCPMLGRRSEAAQRRYRWNHKSNEIFWNYYQHAGRARREGYTVYRRYYPINVEVQ